MGKWTQKSKKKAKIRRKLTWWKRELLRSKDALDVDKANPRYTNTSRYRDGGGISIQDARIKSIEVAIEKLEKELTSLATKKELSKL